MTPDQLKYSLRNKRLQFGFIDLLHHYSVAVFFGLLAISFLYLFIQNFLANQAFSFQRSFEFVVFLGFLVFTYSIYNAQKKRLTLEALSLDISTNDFKTIVEKLAKNNQWELFSFEKLIVLSTDKEKMIILFDNENILVTDFFNPDSFGFLFRIFRKPKLLSIIKNESRR